MQDEKNLRAAHLGLTEEYLRHFAAFFACLAEEREKEAAKAVSLMRDTDRQAEHCLASADLEIYRKRRTELSRLFKTRLEYELNDSIRSATIARAEALIKSFETGRVEN